MKQELVNIIGDYLFEVNTVNIRNKIAKDISNLYGFKFSDQSNMSQIRDGILEFHGLNPETNKIIKIIINTIYKIDIE